VTFKKNCFAIVLVDTIIPALLTQADSAFSTESVHRLICTCSGFDDADMNTVRIILIVVCVTSVSIIIIIITACSFVQFTKGNSYSVRKLLLAADFVCVFGCTCPLYRWNSLEEMTTFTLYARKRRFACCVMLRLSSTTTRDTYTSYNLVRSV